MTITKQKQDIPLPIALLVALVVIGALFIQTSMAKKINPQAVQLILEHFGSLILIIVTVFLVNLGWLLMMVKRAITLTKQGSRLKKLTGEKGSLTKENIRIFIFAFLMGVLTYPLFESLLIAKFRQFWILEEYQILILINFCASVFIFLIFLTKIPFFKKLFSFSFNRLSRFPKPKYAIVLGSSGEEDKEAVKPSWISINKKGLIGNILITGSIGSGKTQGTILPYLDQIFTNFELTPGVLIIDPKRSFVPEAIKIAKKHGLEKRIVHLKLGGQVKINPVFQKDVLKNSGYLNMANMFQAASINFMGSSNESPFWNISSFNLIKNSIVYCAAVHDYYTLEDIYKTIIRASSNKVDQELKDALLAKSFTKEEEFNIGCAISYFEDEYQKLDSKLKTSILATSTAFLNQFQEYNANNIFCPKQDEITINSIDSLIDEGKIFLIDISVPALARSMGTYIKLLFQQSILDRISDKKRGTGRSFVTIIDEYQDVVTAGNGSTLGDERFLSKSREGNAITIVATQSLVSLLNTIGKENPIKELIQNFRTRIAGHSTDLYTIKIFQELIGKEEISRVSHSIGEYAQNAKRNLLLGGFESEAANISESINKTVQLDYNITGKEFSRLTSFEAFAQIYDGITTTFKKLYLKPYYLMNKRLRHNQILKSLMASLTFFIIILVCGKPNHAFGFPNVCTVVNTDEFDSCLDYEVTSDVCTWGPFTRSCARISYYVPSTFIEVFPHEGQTFFSSLPGVKLQMTTLDKIKIPFGVEGNNHTYSFHAHSLAVPFDTVFQTMLCGGTRIEKFCFDGMSEHMKHHWKTGYGDRYQPAFLAWQLNPKACLVKGAIFSATGSPEWNYGNDALCSFPFNWYKTFPPSVHSVCNGWGVTFPRMGTYHGSSQLTASLMIAARMKSLSSEVFQATPGALNEKWQMIYPKTSSCFREGQNMSILETIKGVNELGRLTKIGNGYLYVVWQKTSCKRDWPAVWASKAFKAILKPVCKGLGEI